MGFGIAAPIGLSLAAGRAPVLSVVGDGGLWMYVGELETAVREAARVLYVVFCDGSLALIESAQRRRGLPLHGMRFNVPAVLQPGAALGVPSRLAGGRAELAEAVSAFLRADGPAIVGVAIDPREYDEQGR